MYKKRNTVVFVALLIAAALGGILAQRIFLGEEGSYAIVQSYGGEAARLPLSEDTELVIGDKDRGYNRIIVKDGFIWVEEADCADKICVREGKKNRTGEVIACLPHKLIITVEAPGEEAADSLAW